MKLHFILLKKVAEALHDIFENKKYADKVIEKLFKSNRKLGSRDRKFIAETIYGIVRYHRYYQTVAQSNESYNLLGVHLIKNGLDAEEFQDEYPIDVDLIKANLKKKYPIAVTESFPDWMNEMGEKEFGADEWKLIMQALNKQADVYLRTNTLRITREELIKELEKEEIFTEKVENLPECLRLIERKNVFSTAAFKNGYFEVQDAASQFIAPLLDLKPGLRVVDACAGAGGKSLHMAALMKNKGKIIAMDIHEWKLGELKKRAARNRVDIIEVKVLENTKTTKRLEGSFDRVLLDVPCTGWGVIRRNPDTKWKLSPEQIDSLLTLQREIITDYSKMCKAGGLMVYATCSILNKENEEQVKWFLASPEGQNWSFKKDIRLWPHKDNFDGFYAALLERK
ncbi:RNA methyltransferase [Bdellovibrio sp. qaytius]|nr:RNA methyltransferase [Bdellovibrio sp. qaytius]